MVMRAHDLRFPLPHGHAAIVPPNVAGRTEIDPYFSGDFYMDVDAMNVPMGTRIPHQYTHSIHGTLWATASLRAAAHGGVTMVNPASKEKALFSYMRTPSKIGSVALRPVAFDRSASLLEFDRLDIVDISVHPRFVLGKDAVPVSENLRTMTALSLLATTLEPIPDAMVIDISPKASDATYEALDMLEIDYEEPKRVNKLKQRVNSALQAADTTLVITRDGEQSFQPPTRRAMVAHYFALMLGTTLHGTVSSN